MKILSIKMKRTIVLSLATLLLICSSMVLVAQTNQSTKTTANIKLALNAFSFNDMLIGKGQPGNKPSLTLLELLDWCATENIPAIHVTGYYFPGYPEVPTDEYIYELNEKLSSSVSK